MSQVRSVRVSLCMIVRNEAHQLAECLAPASDLFDEIVIVDTGSRDATREIARQFTSRVFDFAWCDDFSAARNASLEQARGDWIFWLDADDRITPDNVEKLRTLLDGLTLHAPMHPQVIFMDVLCRSRGTGEMERVVSHPRLFRRRADLAWRGRVHEQLVPRAGSLAHETGFCDVRIDHVGYRDAALAQRKVQRNLRLLRMDYAVNPDDPTTLMELGTAHMRLGQLREARRYWTRYLETAPAAQVNSERVFASLAELALQEGRFQEVVDTTARGLVLFPADDYLAYMQTEGLYQLGEYEAAAIVLQRIIRTPPSPRELRFGAPSEIKRKLAPLGLGEVLRVQRALDAAEGLLRQVVRAFPDDCVCWHQLGRIYVDMGNWHRLQEVLARLSACPQGELFASLLLAAWQVVRGQWDEAERALDELIARAPHMSLPRVLRAHCLKLRRAPAPAQLEACRDVLRVHPGNAYAASLLAGREVEARESGIVNRRDLCSSVLIGAGIPSGVVSA